MQYAEVRSQKRGAIAKYALDQAKRQLAVLGFVLREKALEARRDLACMKLAAPAEFLSDVARDVARPSFGGVEAHNADGLPILPVEQVLDDGLEVGASTSVSQ